jgi:uncharacterized protein (DUF362 family)
MDNSVYAAFGRDVSDLAGLLFSGIPYLKSYFRPQDKIVIKPNVLLAKPSHTGATTDPDLVESVIINLEKLGVKNIAVAEGAWTGGDTAEAYDACGYRDMALRHNVDLVDLKNDEFVQVPVKVKNSVLKKVKIAKTILDASSIINIPVLKAHCQARLTCGMKNLMGIISDNEKRRFHRMDLDRAVFELNTVIEPALNICDAITGDLTFEEGGTPVNFGRLFLSRNIYNFDAYAANTLGYEVEEIGYLEHYSRYFSLSGDYTVNHLNEPLDRKDFKAVDYRDRFACGIYPYKACCSCLASIFIALEKKRNINKDLNFYVGMDVGEENIRPQGINILIGNCTKKLDKLGCYVEGCPPDGVQVKRAIDSI